MKVELPVSGQEQILIVRFHVKNKKNKDVIINAGTASNNLCSESHIYYNGNRVFTYAVGIEAGQDELVFDFGEGSYEVSESEAYLLPLSEVSGCSNSTGNMDHESLYQYTFQQKVDSQGNKRTSEVLTGNINMGENGYLITSIPYDENFAVLVDGKECAAELVNEGFLGAKLEKGNHEILIRYKAPGKKAGILLMVFGIMIAVGYCGVQICGNVSRETSLINR